MKATSSSTWRCVDVSIQGAVRLERLCDHSARAGSRGIAILAALALSSCIKEIGPTVPVTAGAGKSQEAFDADRRGCMAMTDQALQPVANQMNAAAQSTDQLQANNEEIQRRYDASFDQCMATKGNVIATAAPADGQAAAVQPAGPLPVGRA